MASPETIIPQATGNTGALSADNMFYVQTGMLLLSTDGGTSQVLFTQGEKVVFSSGLTVTWENPGTETAILHYMPI